MFPGHINNYLIKFSKINNSNTQLITLEVIYSTFTHVIFRGDLDYWFLSNLLISFSNFGMSLVMTDQIISSDTVSYPWIILFLVSTILRVFVMFIPGSMLNILLTASPMISIFLSIARLPFMSFWNTKKLLGEGLNNSISLIAWSISSSHVLISFCID